MEDIHPGVVSRLTMIEFVLEVMLANELARISPDQSEGFKKDLMDIRSKLPPKSGPMAVSDLDEINRLTNIDMENFCRKVSAREDDFRAQHAKNI
jgi:hypothetical protein